MPRTVLLSAILFSITLLTNPNLHAVEQPNLGSRCRRYKNPFVLNKANVNAMVAMICGSLSHIENQRRHMTYEDSGTFFHHWTTTGSNQLIKVSGNCAISYPNLKKNSFDRNAVDLTIRQIEPMTYKYEVTGKMVGKNISLEFDNNAFLDPNCSTSEVTSEKLQRIGIGWQMTMQDVFDIFTSQRGPGALHLLEQESWTQGHANAYHSGLGLQYRLAIAGLIDMALAITTSPSSGELHMRTANYLYYAEDSDYFKMKVDSFNVPDGFLNREASVNHKFQTYTIEGGSQMVGCSSLIYESTLDLPQDVDMYTCKNAMDNSKVKSLLAPRLEKKLTKEEIEIQELRTKQRKFQQLLETYINNNYGPLKRYSSKPNVYETNRAPWTKNDIKRKYVVFQRTVQYSADNVKVIEHRYDLHGNSHLVEYTVKYSSVETKK